MKATEKEVKINLASREEEPPSLTKSDANLSIFQKYQKQIQEYTPSLTVPPLIPMITLSTRSKNYEDKLLNLTSRIQEENHQLIIFCGNVLTGKTHTANRLKSLLDLRD